MRMAARVFVSVCLYVCVFECTWWYVCLFRLKDGAGNGRAHVCVWLCASLYQFVCVSVCLCVRGGDYV